MALAPISQMVLAAATPIRGYWDFTKAYSPTQLENLTFIHVGNVSSDGELVYPTWYLGRGQGTLQVIYLLNGTYDSNTGKLTFFQANSTILNRAFYTGYYFKNPPYANCQSFMTGTWERLFQGGFHASGGWFATTNNVTMC
jgi:hypothetical protein